MSKLQRGIELVDSQPIDHGFSPPWMYKEEICFCFHVVTPVGLREITYYSAYRSHRQLDWRSAGHSLHLRMSYAGCRMHDQRPWRSRAGALLVSIPDQMRRNGSEGGNHTKVLPSTSKGRVESVDFVIWRSVSMPCPTIQRFHRVALPESDFRKPLPIAPATLLYISFRKRVKRTGGATTPPRAPLKVYILNISMADIHGHRGEGHTPVDSSPRPA
jgi:hypothetical protein